MKSFQNFLITSILLMGLLSVALPVSFKTSYPRDIGPQFDERVRKTYIDMLNERKPELMLLGDSMLAPAVNQQVVVEELDQKTLLAGMRGTASTIWYLVLKNNIIVAEHKPKYLAVFFRDSMMTVPGYRVTGRYFEQIDEFASPDDKLLIQRAYINQMSPFERSMEAYVPLYGLRWNIRQAIDSQIRYGLAAALLNCDPDCMDLAMDVGFEANNLDVTFLSEAIAASDDYLYTPEALDFETQIDQSFLPEVIRLCQENDIQLILVRMPILRFEEPGTKPAGLSEYIQDLQAYSEQNGVPFFDLDRAEFTSEYFTDSLHLNERGQAIFTQELVESLKTVK